MEILSNSSMATFNTDKFVQSFEQSLILTSGTDSEYCFNDAATIETNVHENADSQNKKKRRRQRRKGGIPRIDSPSTESSCSSLASMTTMSSGICSIGSSMQTLNEIDKSVDFTSLISSTTASSLIDCNESAMMEELDEAFSEFSFPASDTVSLQQQPKKKTKRKTKKSHKNPIIQQYFNQQKQFYLQIYEQQFAVLSSLKNSNEKGSKKVCHQHLGLPPLPPPPMGFDYNSSSMEEFLSTMGPCEEVYFNQIKQQPSLLFNNNNKKQLSSFVNTSDEFIKSPETSIDDENLSKGILDVYESVTQTERTLMRKLRLRDLLYYSIVQTFPVCGLYVVGSSLNGFGNETSDMDLCFVITNGELDQRTDAVHILIIIEQILSTLPAIKEQTLIRAKVPILRIKFRGPFSDMIVDLNCNNSVAVRNTHLLCYYAFFDWRVRPLVTVIKEWAKQNDINDSTRSTFTSYSLVLMVLHYLQIVDEPVLPSLQQQFPKRFNLRADIRTLNLSHPLEEISSESNFKGSNTSSLGTLLIGFFDYYANQYNYDTNAISIRLGREAKRADVIRHNTQQWSPICIEEPFTRSNTAHSIYDEMIFKSIKQKFQDAHRILSNSLDLNSLLTIQPLTPTESLIRKQQVEFLPQIFDHHHQ